MAKTTFQTAIAIANSSIGSALIIFPLNYLKFGIIENLVFLVIIILISAVDGVHSSHHLFSLWNASQTFLVLNYSDCKENSWIKLFQGCCSSLWYFDNSCFVFILPFSFGYFVWCLHLGLWYFKSYFRWFFFVRKAFQATFDVGFCRIDVT